MKIEILYFEGCPNHRLTADRVREVLREEGLPLEVTEVRITDPDAAKAMAFLGSPSVRIDGMDIEPGSRSSQNFGFVCRTYPSGLPSKDLIRAAIREARMDVKAAIRKGDAEALRRLLAEDASRADALIRWGENDGILTHPLHYVSDMLFEGTLPQGRELPLVEALIRAGANLDFQRDGKGDTPLIGAASLGAEEAGLKLLDAGARPELRGLFGETALHWAALLGEDRLARRLLAGADLNLADENYNSTPLGWAIHGWCDPPAGNQGRQREVVVLLVAAGARVEPAWLKSEKVRANVEMLTTLGTGTH